MKSLIVIAALCSAVSFQTQALEAPRFEVHGATLQLEELPDEFDLPAAPAPATPRPDRKEIFSVACQREATSVESNVCGYTNAPHVIAFRSYHGWLFQALDANKFVTAEWSVNDGSASVRAFIGNVSIDSDQRFPFIEIEE